jgi:hypothetical protein
MPAEEDSIIADNERGLEATASGRSSKRGCDRRRGSGLNPQGAAESPDAIVRLRPVVIPKDVAETTIPPKSTAAFYPFRPTPPFVGANRSPPGGRSSVPSRQSNAGIGHYHRRPFGEEFT